MINAPTEWKVKITRENGIYKGYAERPHIFEKNGKKFNEKKMLVTPGMNNIEDCITDINQRVAHLDQSA